MKSFGLKELAEHYFATESEVTDYVAASDYEKLKAERDAFAEQLEDSEEQYRELHNKNSALSAYVEAMRRELKACQNVLFSLARAGEVTPAYAADAKRVLQSTPQQCLAEIKAEAGRAGYLAGHLDGLGDPDEIDKEHAAYRASQYAAKIRNAGTWLRDENVNGGKRQGDAE